MDYSPSTSGKAGLSPWASPPQAQTDGGLLPDEQSFSISDLMDFDAYSELTASQLLSSFPNFSPALTPSNFQSPSSDFFPVSPSPSPAREDRSAYHPQLGFPSDDDESSGCSRGGRSAISPDDMGGKAMGKIAIPRVPRLSLAERMLRALSLFKESSGAGILAQVWVPIKQGDKHVLSTCEQPYLLDQVLAGYREISRSFTFAAKDTPGCFQGLPGRVFISKMPEWTSNVVYYSKSEFLRVNHALEYQVRGSLAVPILDPHDQSCYAVLELVTTMEKPNFDPEMESICRAIQAVDLRTITARVHPQTQNVSKNQTAAFSDIIDVMRAVCHAHSLPLALTWIPCPYGNNINYWSDCEIVMPPRRSSLLCVQESTCYVNDKQMEGFVHACTEHHLEKGQGLAGKALQSNHPFFCPDVKSYNILEYPLAHHARKFGLNAAVAIRLRSTYTGGDDYILEFFLPISCKDSADQQLLLNNLSSTMQRICRSLRTVSDAELVQMEETKGHIRGAGLSFPSSDDMPDKSLQQIPTANESNVTEKGSLLIHKSGNDGRELDLQSEQISPGLRRQVDKKRSTAEKNISLSVLQQYFSGSLKDAAKSIGVCPTTLKRICRQHGISRWPSRKINKVNRSLRKIQIVMESVQGVEGALKYDPVTGAFVAATSILPGHGDQNSNSSNSSQKDIATVNQEQPEMGDVLVKRETDDDSFMGGQGKGSLGRPELLSAKCKSEKDTLNCQDESKLAGFNVGTSPQNYSKGISNGLYISKENSESHHTSRSSSSMGAADEVDTVRGVEHHQPSSSSMTDSSTGCGSMMNNSASSSPNLTSDDQSKNMTCIRDDGATLTVKATYKEDMVRFKFLLSMGCSHLFDEIGKRFKLPPGSFQLKYLDDEDEWVLLVSQSDLQECIEIMESAGTRSVKLMVRDLPCATGSSASSNCFLAGT